MRDIQYEFLQFIGIYSYGETQIMYITALFFSGCYFSFKFLHKYALEKLGQTQLKWRILQRLILILRKLSFFMMWVSIVLMIICYLLTTLTLKIGGRKFDRNVWLAEQHESNPAPGVYKNTSYSRGAMYDDLDRKHLKFLMKKEDIEKLWFCRI